MDKDNYDVYKATMHKMMRVGRLHRAVFERNISKMGIHHSQHHLLMYISKQEEITSQKHIAEKFGITSAAVARSLKSLESEGYIERTSASGDGRFNRIVITEKGRDIVEKTCRMFEETDRTVFSDFDEKDIETFNSYLDRMQGRLLEKCENICCERKCNEEK